MELQRCKKEYTDATHRIVSPETTLSNVQGIMGSIGVTHIEDITDMDRIGIPVFLAFQRLPTTPSEAVFKGKGASPTEATVSAMMEAIERYSATYREENVLLAPASTLEHDHIDPRSLILPPTARYDEAMTIGWTLGHDLLADSELYIPANAIYHPYPPTYGWLFRSNTNGMASGNCLEEAILHGLCEVVERDAWSLAEFGSDVPKDLVIDTDDAHIVALLEKFDAAQVDVTVKDITSDVGIPTFVAVVDDTVSKDPTLLTIGVGTHLSPRVALVRALTEVAQSRLTQIYENERNPSQAMFKRKLGYERIKGMNKKWYTKGSSSTTFSQHKDLSTPYILDDIDVILECLRPLVSHVGVVDLSRGDISIPVVRIVTPMLEQCSVDRDRVGMRLKKHIGMSRDRQQ
jgi:ribosomal protein S12 methylthiotransferase accessory factor